MTFAENILPALLAVPIGGIILREWIALMLLPSIQPDRVYVPEEKEKPLQPVKIPLLKPDLSKILEKAHKEGLTAEDMDAAIRTVLARKRIETAPDVVRPSLEIIENE